jgi:hypothetical protein
VTDEERISMVEWVLDNRCSSPELECAEFLPLDFETPRRAFFLEGFWTEEWEAAGGSGLPPWEFWSQMEKLYRDWLTSTLDKRETLRLTNVVTPLAGQTRCVCKGCPEPWMQRGCNFALCRVKP